MEPAPTPPGLTHGCVRCGAPVDIDTALCERCNPLGLKDPAASQAHGTIFIGVLVAVVLLAVFARMTVSGVGPFQASVVGATTPAGTDLAVTITVTNTGTNTGATTCRVTDPKDRNGGTGAIVLSPRIDAKQTITFSQVVTELGGTVRPLEVECAAP
jgi:predicted nucleic acid-binding Zn ribbon protein